MICIKTGILIGYAASCETFNGDLFYHEGRFIANCNPHSVVYSLEPADIIVTDQYGRMPFGQSNVFIFKREHAAGMTERGMVALMEGSNYG